MSMLEVLQTFPSEQKAILSTLGVLDPSHDRLIIFDVDKLEHPPLPSLVSFQIPFKI